MRSPHLIRPPQPRMLQPQLCKFLRREFHDLRFPAAQFHGLMKFFPIEFRAQYAFHGIIRNVAHFPTDSQFGSPVLHIQFGGHERIPHRNVSARSEKDFLPNPHVLVRRSGIPIDPGNPQVVFSAAKTSSAMAFTLPGCKYLLTSNSYERYVPATSFASANLCPLIQMLAR